MSKARCACGCYWLQWQQQPVHLAECPNSWLNVQSTDRRNRPRTATKKWTDWRNTFCYRYGRRVGCDDGVGEPTATQVTAYDLCWIARGDGRGMVFTMVRACAGMLRVWVRTRFVRILHCWTSISADSGLLCLAGHLFRWSICRVYKHMCMCV